MAEGANPSIRHEAFAAIQATCAEMDQCERTLKRLKARLSVETQALREVEPGSLRLQMCSAAYWSLPRVNITDLAFAYFGDQHAHGRLKALMPADTGLSCDRCNEPYKALSRADYARALEMAGASRPRWHEGYRLVCKRCESEIHEQRRIRYDREREEYQRMRTEAERLPYDEFLKTDFWASIRAHMFDYVGTWTCSLCEDPDIEFYHKVGSIPAAADHNDLRALCPECAGLLMRPGLIMRRYIPERQHG